MGFVILVMMFNLRQASEIQIPAGVISSSETALLNNASSQSLTQTPNTGTLTVQGYNRTWLSFDGTGDTVIIDAPENAFNTALYNLTTNFWINLSATGNSDKYLFRLDNSTATGSPLYHVYYNGNLANCGTINNISVQVKGTNNELYKAGLDFNKNEWVFVSIVTNSTALTNLYYNAVSVPFSLDTTCVLDGASRTVDQISLTSLTFNGSIDEVRIYNYSLSPEQISYIYSLGRS